MTSKNLFFKRVISVCLMFTMFLVSCNSNTQNFTTDDNYLSLKYSKEMSFAKDNKNGNDVYTFFYNNENFVIVASEDVSQVDPSLFNVQTLTNNAKIFAEPFMSQGFAQTSEENTTIGDNEAYKVSYSDGNFTLTYLQWFDTEKQPPSLYKVMYVYDNDHKDSIEKTVESIKIN